jgi:tyrosinase
MELSQTISRRQALKVAASSVAGTMLLVSRSQVAYAAVPARKNIDALTQEELEIYKHAVSILVQRGASNPSNQEGYDWQAALHNDFERERPDGSVGACEHKSELFFPWHRAHLAGFEKILRETDPPNTASVAIPYWDWTQPASGKRFPVAFEDETSPLYHTGRFFNVGDSIPRIQWDAEIIKAKHVQENDWFLFAGKPPSAGGSYGWVEQGPHNSIHGMIGPTMGNPSAASRDPIYWSFHAYIDLIWARWQRVHVDDNHPQTFTTPDATIWVEPFTPAVKDMAAVTTLPSSYAYTYDYDFSIDGPIVTALVDKASTMTVETRPAGELAVSTEPLMVEAAGRHILRFENVQVLPQVTYRLRAYVHPKSVSLLAIDEAERVQYLADTATIWMSGGHHAGQPTSLNLEITAAIAAYADTQFVITIVTDSVPLPSNAENFGEAKVELDSQIAALGVMWGSLVLEAR